jgi:hypothetical protein
MASHKRFIPMILIGGSGQNAPHAYSEIEQMTTTRVDLAARDRILGLLSDEENAKVSTAEGKTALSQGDEYVDLENLDKGVQRAGTTMPKHQIGTLIPKSAVHAETWKKIAEQLGK